MKIIFIVDDNLGRELEIIHDTEPDYEFYEALSGQLEGADDVEVRFED